MSIDPYITERAEAMLKGLPEPKRARLAEALRVLAKLKGTPLNPSSWTSQECGYVADRLYPKTPPKPIIDGVEIDI